MTMISQASKYMECYTDCFLILLLAPTSLHDDYPKAGGILCDFSPNICTNAAVTDGLKDRGEWTPGTQKRISVILSPYEFLTVCIYIRSV